MVRLEVCVDNAKGLAAAIKGGADRIELCSRLEVGGLTPSILLMELAAKSPLPVHVMIRPKAGGFCFSEGDLAIMEADIAIVRQIGLAGVVLGVARHDHHLDTEALARLIGKADGLDLTLHRVFDDVPDQSAALESAITLGFLRVLTSGGAPSAAQGARMIADLISQARNRITIMPGAGITAKTVTPLLDLPLSEVHGSCSRRVGGRRQTSEAEVRALKLALA